MAATRTALETRAAFLNTESGELSIPRSRRPNHRETSTTDAVESDDEFRRHLVRGALEHRLAAPAASEPAPGHATRNRPDAAASRAGPTT